MNVSPGKKGFQRTGRTERGKVAIPSSSPVLPQGNEPRVSQAADLSLPSPQQFPVAKDLPAWVPASSYSGFRMAEYPELHVGPDSAHGVDPGSRTGDVCLRAVEVGRAEASPGRFTAVYGFPGLTASGGDKPAISMRKDHFTASYSKGVVDEQGEFHADHDRFLRAVDRWLDRPECPLASHDLGTLDDYQIRSVSANAGDREVAALHVTAYYTPSDTQEEGN